ncbi:AI-2E family transporter [Halobaculum marinum]|uniref:AI-2E family transporter n=1 Tax=Halobaculum marinum TaxID=3031996 RepID=A0ABD5WWX2_9EURY|nr:AI-2E family transporter [Halobaculum sp. DT55]
MTAPVLPPQVTPQRRFLLALAAVTALVAVWIVAPLAQYVLVAVLLAYVLQPVQRRLAPRVGARVSAVVVILVSVGAIVAPVAVVLAVAVRAIDQVRGALVGDGVDFGALEELAAAGGVDLRGELTAVTRRVFDSGFGTMLELFGGVSDALIGLTVLLFVVYYLLVDGQTLVAWVERATPLESTTSRRLRRDLDRITWGVVVGNVAIAVVQGVLTGLVFALVGVSNVVFWTVVTTLLSLLPLIGASIVWIPMAVFLFLSGRPVDAAVVFVLGAGVISLSDNYLRPIVTGHEAHVSPGLMVVGIFGGVLAFGFVGLFVGPIVLAFAKTLVDTLVDEDRHPAEA